LRAVRGGVIAIDGAGSGVANVADLVMVFVIRVSGVLDVGDQWAVVPVVQEAVPVLVGAGAARVGVVIGIGGGVQTGTAQVSGVGVRT